MPGCEITIDNGAYCVSTPYYNEAWLAEFKSTIPYTDRKPKKVGRAFFWIVSPRYGKVVQDLCNKYFGELPLLPAMANVKPIIKQQILDVRYIGMTKDRGSDERSAYGWYRDGWNVIFPETVLRAWFDAPADPTQAVTLYSVLGVRREASAEEIKAGWRRMVMQWHPDKCKEPNAQEQFIAIQHAYEVLTKSRDRYDAGLTLEASIKNHPQQDDNPYSNYQGYRAPLRCGLIMCEGIESMGVFQVSKIMAWQDITDQYGRVLVVSWPRGYDHFEEAWA